MLRFGPFRRSSSILSYGEGLKGRHGVRFMSASVLLTGILALAAVVRLWGLGFGLPHTQARPDETQIIDVTLYFLRGDFKPKFYDYPWLYMWLLTGLYLGSYAWGLAIGSFHSLADVVASWPTNWQPLLLISRGLSVAAGVGTVAVVYRLGRKLWDEQTGLVAALFMALVSSRRLSFRHHRRDDDAIHRFFGVRAGERTPSGNRSVFALAGLLGGLATGTKYNGVFLAAPFLVSQLLHAHASPGRRLAAFLDARLLWLGVPFLFALAVGIPFVFTDADRFWGAMGELAHSMRVGQGSMNPDNGWLHHLTYSLRYGLSLPLLVAGVAGVIALGVREPRRAALLFAFPLMYLAVAGSFGSLFFRYMIPVVPFLALAAAWVVTASIRWLIPSGPAVAAAAALVVLPSAISLIQFDRIASATGQPRDRRGMVFTSCEAG